MSIGYGPARRQAEAMAEARRDADRARRSFRAEYVEDAADRSLDPNGDELPVRMREVYDGVTSTQELSVEEARRLRTDLDQAINAALRDGEDRVTPLADALAGALEEAMRVARQLESETRIADGSTETPRAMCAEAVRESVERTLDALSDLVSEL